MSYQAQKDTLGCAIAAVANVCGITYDEAKTAFVAKHAISRGYYCSDIVHAFKLLGHDYAFSHVSSIQQNIHKNGTIVFVQSKRMPAGHYLARANNEWADSWINFCSQDNLNAKAGVRKKLPGTVEWIIYPI